MTAGRRPSFFVVGAPKAGTTSLYDWLSGHPQLYMSPVKEPFYFCPDVQGGLRRQFAFPQDEARYLDLFAPARHDQRCGEASSRYLVSRLAPGLVRDFAPGARAIVMLRNPVDLVRALHSERVSLGAEPIADLAAALDADEDRRAGRRLPAGANALGSVYRDVAIYDEQLERWFAALGREDVLVVVFDDLVADPAAQFQAVLRFLDVDPEYRPATFAASNPSHRLRGGGVRAALNSRGAQWAAHSALPALLGQNRTHRLARGFRMSRLNRRRVPRDDVPAALRSQLEAEFMPSVGRLSDLLGRDFGSLWFGRSARPEGAGPVSSAVATPSKPEPA